MALATSAEPVRVAQVRAFNRFYTRVIGVLQAGYVGTPFSLIEARLLYELAQRDSTPSKVTQVGGAALQRGNQGNSSGNKLGQHQSDDQSRDQSGTQSPNGGQSNQGHLEDGIEGAELRRLLDLDAGYLSRILSRLDANGLVRREPFPADARRQIIRLTDAGRAAFAGLEQRQVNAVQAMLAPLNSEQQATLTTAMATIERTLGGQAPSRGFLLRPPEPGELGWVVARHGALYAQEYGWDVSFEALVARIVADYADGADPAREACWIAEVDGRPAGSVFCVTDPDDQTGSTAKLRLLLVEPSTRGMGIGERLVDECLRFARRAGYRRITLWTNSVLHAARRNYQRAGFTLDEEQPHHSFGHDLVGQSWSREL